jgi:hypothetical protein
MGDVRFRKHARDVARRRRLVATSALHVRLPRTREHAERAFSALAYLESRSVLSSGPVGDLRSENPCCMLVKRSGGRPAAALHPSAGSTVRLAPGLRVR